MPRKNTRAERPRLKRNRHAPAPIVKPHPGAPPPRPIHEMVRPQGFCPSKKSRYADEETAQRALDDAQRGRLRAGKLYVEKRYYRCDRCNGYHLTSRETFEKRPNP